MTSLTPTVGDDSRRLLLFDIDGTLIDTEGAGLWSFSEAFYLAFPEHCGRLFPPLELGGATDHGLIMHLFEHFGLEDSPNHRSRFFEAYTGQLAASLEHFAREGRGRLLPGVGELLDTLAAEERVALAVLTGNTEAGARVKLRHFRIDHHFPIGAYGDDHHDRNELGPIARERALECFGKDFRADEIIVIGDTLRDIACARAFGAKVIAVATGAATRAELASGAPDVLLDDLSDREGVFAALQSVFFSSASA